MKRTRTRGGEVKGYEGTPVKMEAASVAKEPCPAKTSWRKKCMTLKRKCDQIEQSNDILYAKSRQIYKMIQRAEAEKKMLMERLEQYEMETAEVYVPAGKRVKMTESVSPPPPPSLLPRTLPATDNGQERSQDAASSTSLKQDRPTPSPSVQTQRSAPMKKPKQSPASASKQTSRLNPSSSVMSPKSTKRPTKGGAKSSPASRRRKGDVDANAPKKPSNAFFWFCQKHRGSFEDRFRGEGVAGQHSLTKILAQKWAETPAEDKQIYYLKYSDDKKRYDREMQAYQSKKQEQQQLLPGTSSVPPTTGLPETG